MVLATPKNSGFTLIEVLIVVFITAILVMAGVAAYTKFNKSQASKQDVLNFGAELTVIKKMAAAGSNSCASGRSFLGYRIIHPPAEPKKATVYLVCSNPVTETAVKIITLTGNSVFTGDNSFRFGTKGQMDDPAWNQTITIKGVDGIERSITITPGGVLTYSF